MEGSALQLENRTQVIVWLRENYKHATTTSVSKRSVFGHYLEACQNQGVLTPISHTYFGKLVRKAFPDVRCNRKGPRGSAQQHYRLLRVDGGDSSAFMAAHMGDEEAEEEEEEEEDEREYARRRRPSVKRNQGGAKGSRKAATLRKNGPSRVRAAATAAASTISRMISADQQATTEAWSFSSAPSSPVHSSSASIPSSPAQSSSEDDGAVEEEYEAVEEEYEEEEAEEVEEESGELINFELPQFEITPGEESPGTSFSYEACPTFSGHEQNLLLQQQLQLQQQQLQCQQQQQQGVSYFEPTTFYDFVSPDLEMPLSAINQVNLMEDFGWNMPSTSAAYHHQQQQQQAYHHQPQQQQYYYQQSFLADQLPAAQCSDLVEWVEHYCN